jgi:hypothetical protein
MQVVGGPNNMTQENCQAACKAAGYILAGVEYSDECYCGNQLAGGGGPAPDGNALCDMTCNGNTTEICGGPNRLTMFEWSNGPPPPYSSASATTSSVSTSASAGPTAIPSGWSYQGCWADNVNNTGRSLNFEMDTAANEPSMTRELCVSLCANAGYPVSGTEYYYQCFCDTGMRNGATQIAPSLCNTPCQGNTTEMCGGPNALSVYSIGNITTYQPPSVLKSALGGNWTYVGCLIDGANGTRAFPDGYDNTSQTLESCLLSCQAYGFPYGGPEFGDQCYCGDDATRVAHGAVFAPDSDCAMMSCPGNATEYCGWTNRIAYYKFTGPEPLYVWHYPQGTAAGQYSFLIGGVTVPLLTTQGVNGKVMFQEKSGTGKTEDSSYMSNWVIVNDRSP